MWKTGSQLYPCGNVLGYPEVCPLHISSTSHNVFLRYLFNVKPIHYLTKQIRDSVTTLLHSHITAWNRMQWTYPQNSAPPSLIVTLYTTLLHLPHLAALMCVVKYLFPFSISVTLYKPDSTGFGQTSQKHCTSMYLFACRSTARFVFMTAPL